MSKEYELLRRKDMSKKRKVCQFCGIGLLLALAVACILAAVYLWYTDDTYVTPITNMTSFGNLTDGFSITKDEPIRAVELVDNNTISFEATIRLTIPIDQARRRRSLDCNQAKSDFKAICSGDLNKCQNEKLEEYLENYIVKNFKTELSGKETDDGVLGALKSIHVKLSIFKSKVDSLSAKANVTLIYTRTAPEANVDTIEQIIEKLRQSSDKCSASFISVDDMKLGLVAYNAYKRNQMVHGLIGEWKLVSSENFEESLADVGVGYMLRKIAASQNPKSIIKYNENSNKWSIITETPFRTLKIEFELGKEFKENLPDDRPGKSTIIAEQNKFIHRQLDLKGNVVSVQSRELINENSYMLTINTANVVAKRVYERIK